MKNEGSLPSSRSPFTGLYNRRSFAESFEKELERLITPKAVCAVLEISRPTLSRLCKKRLINFVKVRGQYRFRVSAVQLYIAQNETKAAA